MGGAVGSKLEKQEAIKWRIDMGPVPPQLMVHALIVAAMTFPVGTGLGWDASIPEPSAD